MDHAIQFIFVKNVIGYPYELEPVFLIIIILCL